MINSLTVKNFRGIKQLELPELAPFTLLTGRNNVGKSSILEAIFLFIGHTDVEIFSKLNLFRGIGTFMHPSAIWDPLFYGLDSDSMLEIAMSFDEKQSSLSYERDDNYIPADKNPAIQNAYSQFSAGTRSTYTLKFNFKNGADYTEEGAFSINDTGFLRNIVTNRPNNQIRYLPGTHFINWNTMQDPFIVNAIGSLELKGQKPDIVKALQIIEPNLSDIITISNQGHVQLYAKISSQILPLKLAGYGLNRLLLFILAILNTPNSVVLIDEFGAGIHYSSLPKCWQVALAVARENNCQIIATTHSYECLQSALAGIEAANLQDDFCLYRIERQNEENRAFRYNGELARFAVDSNMEVR